MKNPWRRVYDLPSSVDPWKNGVPSFALYLDIEPTNYCNFNCSFCVAKQQMKRKKGYMDLSLFENICEQGRKYGTYGVRFLRWGEPLLHSSFPEMVKMATDYGLMSQLTTNASLLSYEKSIEIVSAGLDTILISMQGTSQSEYEKFRGDNYGEVIKGLKNIRAAREMLGKANPYIVITSTVTDESEEEIESFKKYASTLADDVSIGYTWFRRLKEKNSIQNVVKRAKKLPHRFKCQEVMIKLSIDWDGTVSPCCLDYDQQLSVGNIKTDDLMDLWKSENVKSIRDLLTHKRQDLFVLCSTCELNYSFRGKHE